MAKGENLRSTLAALGSRSSEFKKFLETTLEELYAWNAREKTGQLEHYTRQLEAFKERLDKWRELAKQKGQPGTT